MSELEQKYQEYLDNEFISARRAVCRNLYSSINTPRQTKEFNKEIVRNAIDRCLGVCLFIQTLNAPYNSVAPVYEETKEKLENLLTI